jgi:hypothetical protein
MNHLKTPSCRDCGHHEWINRFTPDERELCRDSRRISCVFARAEGAKCGTDGNAFKRKEL